MTKIEKQKKAADLTRMLAKKKSELLDKKSKLHKLSDEIEVLIKEIKDIETSLNSL